jgi:N-acetyl-anhydromuramyl-L-alanine amidase AmpD
MRHIDEIIIHCTATTPEFMKDEPSLAKVETVRRWHTQERGWSDIGYHWLIDRDGTVLPGRPEYRTGAHVRGKNKSTIGISLFGGYASNESDKFSDHFTPEQDEALRKLLSEVSERHSIEKIAGHNDYAPKACPGFRVEDWLKD